jgi:hypothetical protein
MTCGAEIIFKLPAGKGRQQRAVTVRKPRSHKMLRQHRYPTVKVCQQAPGTGSKNALRSLAPLLTTRGRTREGHYNRIKTHPQRGRHAAGKRLW